MKKVFLILLILSSLFVGCNKNNDEPVITPESEVTLFNKQAKPIAYINYLNNDSTIYMWNGIPVAYIEKKEKIYHFNGQFLGWYVNGVLYNKEGYAVAAKKGITRGEIKMNDTYVESAKGVKHLKPIPNTQSLPPATPLFKDEWSVAQNSIPKFFLTATTLFDKNKEASAYIDYADDQTIYMWDGSPVAYVEEDQKIYHFDGHFLGWYIHNILYDKEGYAVAAEKGVLKGAISMITPQVEPIKAIKQDKPKKEIKEPNLVLPHFENSWSEIPITDFFLSK